MKIGTIENTAISTDSLGFHLLNQVRLSDVDEKEKKINVGEGNYFKRSL